MKDDTQILSWEFQEGLASAGVKEEETPGREEDQVPVPVVSCPCLDLRKNADSQGRKRGLKSNETSYSWILSCEGED